MPVAEDFPEIGNISNLEARAAIEGFPFKNHFIIDARVSPHITPASSWAFAPCGIALAARASQMLL
jgi:hypothetical protein